MRSIPQMQGSRKSTNKASIKKSVKIVSTPFKGGKKDEKNTEWFSSFGNGSLS